VTPLPLPLIPCFLLFETAHFPLPLNHWQDSFATPSWSNDATCLLLFLN